MQYEVLNSNGPLLEKDTEEQLKDKEEGTDKGMALQYSVIG